MAATVLRGLDLASGHHPGFLFGSVAPDADKLARLPRDTTHFWSPRDDVSGALKLLHAYPHLEAEQLPPAERAFIAGYLCHLVTDEQWTFVVYRPYFGRHSSFAASQEGAEVQWALHSVLEVRQHSGQPALPGLLRQLAQPAAALPAARLSALLPFVDGEALARWRDAVVEVAALAPGGARFARLGELLVPAGQAERPMGTPAPGPQRPTAAPDHLAAFVARLPALQARAASHVPLAAIEAFARRAEAESQRLVGDYLAGRPLQPPRDTADPRTTSRAT